MATGLRALLTMLLCLPQFAAGEALSDPTRPPLEVQGGAGATVQARVRSRGLQSVIISPEYRAAIIHGETVRLGGRVGDSRLVEVREDSVVLQNAQGRRVLELFPRVKIRVNEPSPPQSGAEEQASGRAQPSENEQGGGR